MAPDATVFTPSPPKRVTAASAGATKPLSDGDTGAGGDDGIDHTKNWPRFTYVFTFVRPQYLPPHPYSSAINLRVCPPFCSWLRPWSLLACPLSMSVAPSLRSN
jgi:hypothetical protein